MEGAQFGAVVRNTTTQKKERKKKGGHERALADHNIISLNTKPRTLFFLFPVIDPAWHCFKNETYARRMPGNARTHSARAGVLGARHGKAESRDVAGSS